MRTFILCLVCSFMLCCAAAYGTAELELTPIYCMSFSPDGQKLAFVAEIDSSINVFFVNTDGTCLQKCSPLSEDVVCSRLEWSKDGREVSIFDDGGTRIKSQRVLPDTHTNQSISVSGKPYSADVHRQPDWVIKASDDTDCLVEKKDGGKRWVLRSVWSGYVHPCFTPDGKMVAFIRQSDHRPFTKFLADGYWNYDDIWIVGADGGNERRLTHLYRLTSSQKQADHILLVIVGISALLIGMLALKLAKVRPH